MQVTTRPPIAAFADIHDYINRAISLSKELIHWQPECRGYDRVTMRKLTDVDVIQTVMITMSIALLIHLLTPWSRVLLEKLIGSQLVKKFPAFYGTRKFITAFTSASYMSLS